MPFLCIRCCLIFQWGILKKAFKRAAESMEKLMDAVREELPGTMAAVRLSGMEISDLTMELSDLGLASKTPLPFSLLTKFQSF